MLLQSTLSIKNRYFDFEPESKRSKCPSQPPPFWMPSKLLILHEVKSECFTIGCVSESSFNYF